MPSEAHLLLGPCLHTTDHDTFAAPKRTRWGTFQCMAGAIFVFLILLGHCPDVVTHFLSGALESKAAIASERSRVRWGWSRVTAMKISLLTPPKMVTLRPPKFYMAAPQPERATKSSLSNTFAKGNTALLESKEMTDKADRRPLIPGTWAAQTQKLSQLLDPLLQPLGAASMLSSSVLVTEETAFRQALSQYCSKVESVAALLTTVQAIQMVSTLAHMSAELVLRDNDQATIWEVINQVERPLRENRLSLTGSQMADLMSSLAVMGSASRAMVDRWGQNLAHQRLIDNLEAQDCCKVIDALALLELRDPPLIAAISRRLLSFEMEEEQWAQVNVPRLAWGIATLRVQEGLLLEHLKLRLLRPEVMNSLDPQGLSMTAWAYATAGIWDESLFGAIESRATQPGVMAGLSGPQLADLLWALGKQHTTYTLNNHMALLEAATNQASLPDVQQALSSSSIVRLTSGLAMLGMHPSALGITLAQQLHKRGVASLSVDDIATAFWAFGTLKVEDSSFWGGLVKGVMPFLSQLSAAQLVSIASALATLKDFDKPLLWAIAESLNSLDSIASLSGALTVEAITALASAKMAHGALIRKLAAHLMHQPTFASLDDNALSRVAYALAMLNYSDAVLFSALETHFSKGSSLEMAITVDAWTVPLAFAVMGSRNDELFSSLLPVILPPPPTDERHCSQVLAVLLHVELNAAVLPASTQVIASHGDTITDLRTSYMAGCKKAASVSPLQHEVAAALRRMHIAFDMAAPLPKAVPYCADFLLTDNGLVIDLGRPEDYLWSIPATQLPEGAFSFRQSQLKAAGYQLISIPFYEWAQLNQNDQAAYIKRQMEAVEKQQ